MLKYTDDINEVVTEFETEPAAGSGVVCYILVLMFGCILAAAVQCLQSIL